MHISTVGFSARLIFALCAIGLAAVILGMIRKGVLKEKYALLWLPLGGGFLALSLFPDLLVAFSAKVHLHYITVVMLAVIVVFTTILLYFTLRMSQLREDVKTLAQEIALSRAREAAASATAVAAAAAAASAAAAAASAAAAIQGQGQANRAPAADQGWSPAPGAAPREIKDRS